MGLADRAEHKGEEVKGTAKEKVGDLTDDESLQAQGANERDAAKVKQAGDHVRDAAHQAKEAITDE